MILSEKREPRFRVMLWMRAFSSRWSRGGGGGCTRGCRPRPRAICYRVCDAGRSLVCTQDQLLMPPEGTLAPASDLPPGGKLLDQNGNDVLIVEVIMGTYSGVLYRFETSLSAKGSIDGHLILAGGGVAEDFGLQSG